MPQKQKRGSFLSSQEREAEGGERFTLHPTKWQVGSRFLDQMPPSGPVLHPPLLRTWWGQGDLKGWWELSPRPGLRFQFLPGAGSEGGKSIRMDGKPRVAGVHSFSLRGLWVTEIPAFWLCSSGSACRPVLKAPGMLLPTAMFSFSSNTGFLFSYPKKKTRKLYPSWVLNLRSVSGVFQDTRSSWRQEIRHS